MCNQWVAIVIQDACDGIVAFGCCLHCCVVCCSLLVLLIVGATAGHESLHGSILLFIWEGDMGLDWF